MLKFSVSYSTISLATKLSKLLMLCFIKFWTFICNIGDILRIWKEFARDTSFCNDVQKLWIFAKIIPRLQTFCDDFWQAQNFTQNLQGFQIFLYHIRHSFRHSRNCLKVILLPPYPEITHYMCKSKSAIWTFSTAPNHLVYQVFGIIKKFIPLLCLVSWFSVGIQCLCLYWCKFLFAY